MGWKVYLAPTLLTFAVTFLVLLILTLERIVIAIAGAKPAVILSVVGSVAILLLAHRFLQRSLRDL